MDSITEAYNRMYLSEAVNLWQIIQQSPKAAAAWPDYEKYRQQGMSNAEALQKSGLKSALAIGASVAGSATGGKLGSLLGPKGAAFGSLVGGTIPAIELPNWVEDMYQQRSKTGRYDPEVAAKRATENRENAGIFLDDKTGEYTYDPSRRNRDAIDDEVFANWNENKLRNYAANLSGYDTREVKPSDYANPEVKKGDAQKPMSWWNLGVQDQNQSGTVNLPDGTTRYYNANDGKYYADARAADKANKENATSSRGGDRVVAPRNGVPGTMIPGKPETWKEIGQGTDAVQDMQNYRDRGGILNLGKTGEQPTSPSPEAKPEEKPQGRNWQNPYGQQSDKPSEGNFRDQFPQGNSELDDIINEPYTADQNIPPNKPGDVTKPEDVKKPEDKEGDKGDKGNIGNLTPMQQWAKNFPKLAAKVKAGQVGYDEIQAMNKPQATGSVSGTSADGKPIMTADVEKRNQERAARQRPSGTSSTPGGRKGLMDVLGDYQREHGYGDDAPAPSPQRTPSAGAQTQRTSANNSSDTGMIGTGTRGVTARTAPGRAVERVWDGAADVVQGTSNAARRINRSQPVQKVKDAVQDTVKSQTVQTVKNQAGKGLNYLNNKRKELTAPLPEGVMDTNYYKSLNEAYASMYEDRVAAGTQSLLQKTGDALNAAGGLAKKGYDAASKNVRTRWRAFGDGVGGSTIHKDAPIEDRTFNAAGRALGPIPGVKQLGNFVKSVGKGTANYATQDTKLKNLKKEELEELVFNFLIESGMCDTQESALIVVEHMTVDYMANMISNIVEEDFLVEGGMFGGISDEALEKAATASLNKHKAQGYKVPGLNAMDDVVKRINARKKGQV